MRKLVIDRLVSAKHFPIDWSKDLTGARASYDILADKYRKELEAMPDENLLIEFENIADERYDC